MRWELQAKNHKFATNRISNSKRLVFKNENSLKYNENGNEQAIFAFAVPCLYLQCNQNLLLSPINRILMFKNWIFPNVFAESNCCVLFFLA